MATVLITGSKESVPEVAKAVAEAGGEPLTVHSAAELDEALKGLEKGGLAHYIQLPISVDVSGDDITGRVMAFLEQGIMGRFRKAEAVLPYLADDAKVVLVAGNTPLERNAPDDRQARFSLIQVLARSVRSDKPGIQVQVVQREVGAAAIAAAGLTGTAVAETPTVDPDLGYDDWRTEVLGMATTEI